MLGSGGKSAATAHAAGTSDTYSIWAASIGPQRPSLSAAGAALALVGAMLAGGCAGGGGSVAPQASLAPKSEPMFPETKWGEASVRVATENERISKGGGQYKIGKPYQVADKWYNPREQPEYDRVGIASWYGSDFHGRRTSNGEVYDMHALTAAHPTLPMPSYVYVTNQANGRTIMVRVNDRGPYVANRIIDLSKASAHALDLHGGGVGRVRVTYAGPAPLDGNDSKERQFLASQSWNGGPSRFADTRTGETGSISARPTFARAPAPPPQSIWPDARVEPSQQGWSQADAGDPAPGGWTAAAYRAGLVGR
jgi:rare lipoprotein A